MKFIYSQYSCEESLREAGFDSDEINDVRQYLCQDEVENLKAQLYAATEDRDYYEYRNDSKAQDINEMTEFLYEIKDDLVRGRKTKAVLAKKIEVFLEEL